MKQLFNNLNMQNKKRSILNIHLQKPSELLKVQLN